MVHEVDLKFDNREDASKFLSEIQAKYGLSIAGLDEVGRGPLAADVVVACVILPPEHNISGIKDSKKLSAKRREELSEEITSVSTYGIGSCSASEIDEINIHRAIRKAAMEALAECTAKSNPDFLLCDGGLDFRAMTLVPTTSVIKGDNWFECIASASIVAKVYHDNLMKTYHEMWPEYGFDTNMGYGTAAHLEAIRKYGLSPIHRRTFGICRSAVERE